MEKILSNGQRAGYRAWDDVLTSGAGRISPARKRDFLRWPHVADAILGMILLDQWLDPEERPLPSEAEQIALLNRPKRKRLRPSPLPPGGH